MVMAAERPQPENEARIELRRAEALKLRVRGVSYTEIAKQLGYSSTQAFDDVKKVLRRTMSETDENASEVRELDLQRIDEAMYEVWEILQADKPTDTGDADADFIELLAKHVELKLKAVDRFVRLQERRSKLLGLDAPTKLEVGAVSPDEHWRNVKAWFQNPTPELEQALRECGWQRVAVEASGEEVEE